jgi:hypothetical protein
MFTLQEFIIPFVIVVAIVVVFALWFFSRDSEAKEEDPIITDFKRVEKELEDIKNRLGR